jgi:hypothetical protein
MVGTTRGIGVEQILLSTTHASLHLFNNRQTFAMNGNEEWRSYTFRVSLDRKLRREQW